MTIDPHDAAAYISLYVFPAAFALLPAEMDTPKARAFLIAAGLQETKFQHRHQVNGPARGFWQFERGGGTRGVLLHPATAAHVEAVCQQLRYHTHLAGDVADYELQTVLEDNDVLACVFARLLLWTLPDALPGREEREVAWGQYLQAWRPGHPRRESWDFCYMRAWDLVTRTGA